jgi:hypothetical protein
MSEESKDPIDYTRVVRNCLAAFLFGYLVGIGSVPII